MTVIELKERLEILIMEDRADYRVFVDELDDECVFNINDKDKEVYLQCPMIDIYHLNY
jgi:hypothetical protein